MGRLENKVAIVTGATSGIGQATAVLFAKEGAKVIGVGRSEAKGAETAEKIAEFGGEFTFVAADLMQKESIDKIKEALLEKYDHIDVLANCAGILIPMKPYLEQTDEDFDRVMRTNLLAYSWTMQAFIPMMVENGGGSIVNVASISSCWPEAFSYYYGTTKAGVTNLSKNVAKEYATKHVRINCVLPGPVKTGMTPPHGEEATKFMCENICILGREGEPDDIAYACLYFASDESSWTTGAQLIVDGGVCLGGPARFPGSE